METLVKGNIITMDDDMPDAQYMLIEDGKIKEISETEIDAPDAEVIETDDYVFPGLIEPHGHPMDTAVLVSKDVVDVRPVVIDNADDAIAAIKKAVKNAEPGQPILANGWDPLLVDGLPIPHYDVLDKIAPDNPLVIVHNSLHSVYFNSEMAKLAGVDDSTPDPVGSQWIKEDGKLVGEGHEAGCVEMILTPVLEELGKNSVEYMRDYCQDLNAKGITTCADLTGGVKEDAEYMAARDAGVMTMRIRTYQQSTEKNTKSKISEDDKGMFRQCGVKIWSDGSPWIGNIYNSKPYLTNDVTKNLGLEPNHKGKPNYTKQQIHDVCEPLVSEDTQFACHAHGDKAIDDVLDVYEDLITKHNLKDHRFRMEHCGLMTPEQYKRAADLGVTCGIFVDHVYYWGDVLVESLFGEEVGGAWANAGEAEEAGCSVTYHNDGSVTPSEPFRNMQVAQDRKSKSGRVLKAGKKASREQALKAHTTEAAYQLKEEDNLGSLTKGKYGDFIVIDKDPRKIDVDEFADLQVKETYLAGEQVYKA